MISLNIIFIIFIVMGVIFGLMRGWAKELLVTMSALLGLFVIMVFHSYVEVYKNVVEPHEVVHVVTDNQLCEDVARILNTSVEKMVAANSGQLTLESCNANIRAGMVLKYTNYTTRFWAKTAIMVAMAFIGYETPVLKVFQNASRREGMRDSLLGGVVGGVNAYLIVGSIWAFMAEAQYDNFGRHVIPPMADTDLALTAARWLESMPPNTFLMETPAIFFLVAAAFAIVLFVYV
jgi:uncharacterized membrane protein required for colicin V production